MLWENPSELFGQLNVSKKITDMREAGVTGAWWTESVRYPNIGDEVRDLII